jgi:pimeloyl-ACP methyl ester carboxylesterase
MPRTFSTTLSRCCLALLLPCAGALHAQAAETSETAAVASEPLATERPAMPERSQDEALALQEQLPANEQQQLQAGEETFLALWQPTNLGEAQGVVILLPGAGETADWPLVIAPLRSKLPDVGWQTLSITLPDPQPTPNAVAVAEAKPDEAAAETPAAPAAPDSDAAADSAPASPATAESLGVTPEQHAERVMARIQAAVAFAQEQKPKSIVLLGHGTGGYWAARYLSEQPTPTVTNLLLVAAIVPEQFTPPLDELVAKLQLAVGDFYYKNQALDRTAALKRLHASKRQKNPSYVQIAMSALPGNRAIEQEQLYRRIRGWLSLQMKANGSAP